MPRSVRDSDDEPETRAVRKRRSPNAVDSPLRRSRRVQQSAKYTDTSPESVASDVSGVQTRVTRRRAGTMDSSTAESHRTLRARKNSTSSEVSELADSEMSATPSKRSTRRSAAAVTAGDTPKKTRSSGKRFTRAGSETRTSPPPVRVTRQTRANSMDPESIKDFKLKELHVELPSTPIKTRSRASMVPTESPVKEETEENNVITIEDTVTEVDEPDDTEIEMQEPSKVESETANKSDNNTSEEKEPKEKDNNESSVVPADKTATNDDTNTTIKSPGTSKSNKDGNSSSDISSVGAEHLSYISDELSRTFAGTSKKLVSSAENTMKTSANEEELNNSNKENENVNIINEIQTHKEILSTNVALASPKPFVSDISFKMIKEKDKLSTSKESTLQNCSLKESAEKESAKLFNKSSDVKMDVSSADKGPSTLQNFSRKDSESKINEGLKRKSSFDIEAQAPLPKMLIIAKETVGEEVDIDKKVSANEEMDVDEETDSKQLDIEDKQSKETANTSLDAEIREEITEKLRNTEITEKEMDDKETINEKTVAKKDLFEKMDTNEDVLEEMDLNIETSCKEPDIPVKDTDVSESNKGSEENDNQNNNSEQTKVKELEVSSNETCENTTQSEKNEEKLDDSEETDVKRAQKESSSSIEVIQSDEELTTPEKNKETFVDRKTTDDEMSGVKRVQKESSSSIEVIQSDEEIMTPEKKKETFAIKKVIKKEEASNDNETVNVKRTRKVSLSSDEEEVNTGRDRRESVSSIETVVLISSDTDFCRNTVDSSEIVSEQRNVTVKTTLSSQSSGSVLETSEICVDKKNSDVVKTAQSSIVTETQEEATEKELERKLEESNEVEESAEKEAKKEKDSSETKESQKDNKMEVDSDSDTNIANLFQDVSADEWKKKSKRNVASEGSSEQSIPMEQVEQGSETECDLILVDREAWLQAERLKAAKEKENFDYDSDDTVVMKSRLDSMIESDDENLNLSVIKEESKLEESEDSKNNQEILAATKKKLGSAKKLNVSNKSLKSQLSEKSPAQINSNKSNLLQKLETTSDAEPVEKMQQSSDEFDDEEMNLSQSEAVSKNKALNKSANEKTPNVSLRKKNVKEQGSASKKLSTMQTKQMGDEESSESDDNVNVIKTPGGCPSLNISSKKTPKSESNKSLKNMSQKEERNKNQDVLELSQKGSTKKILTKSRIERISMNSDSSDSMNLSIVTTKRRSLNVSSKKPSVIDPETETNVSSQDKSESESESETNDSDKEEMKTSVKKGTSKKHVNKNYSTLVHIGSDSEEVNSISSESEENIVKIPKFLFNEASSEEDESTSDVEKKSDASMDSDIEREYNLKGKSILKYSDDGVPGDDCRASESEYSDPDDNGSDLADFVVDDENVEEEDDDEDEEEEREKVEAEENDQEPLADEEENVESEEKMEETEKVESKKGAEMLVDEEENSIDAKFSSDEESAVEEIDTKQKTKEKRTGEELAKKLSKVSINQKSTKKNSAEPLSLSLQEKSKTMKETDSVKNISFESSMLKGNKLQDFEKQLNESDFIFSQKLNKFHAAIGCSTPKVIMRNKLATSLLASSVSSQNRSKSEIDIAVSKEQAENVSSKKKSTKGSSFSVEKLYKGSELENEQSLMHRSLPTKSDSMKEIKKRLRTAEKHQTMTVENNDATIQYLRKTKLNESAPVINSKEDSVKSRRKSSEKLQDEEKVEDTDIAASIKRKPKKPKTVKQDKYEETEEIYQSSNMKSEKHSTVSNDSNNVLIAPEEKKKKKKKKTTVQLLGSPEIKEEVVEEGDEDTAAIKLNKKKKKKKAEVNENMTPELIYENDSATKKKRKVNEQKEFQKEEIELEEEPRERKKKEKQNVLQLDEQELKPTKSKKQKLEIEKAIKETEDSVKIGKELKKKKQKEHIQRMQEEKETEELEAKLERSRIKTRSYLKRLPEEVLDNLPDVPVRPKKKPKKEQQVRPSRSMFTSANTELAHIEVDYSRDLLSSYGSTTEFEVINLKSKKPNTKKQALASFRQKMLSRNSRQPISSYLMYLQKQKASGKK